MASFLAASLAGILRDCNASLSPLGLVRDLQIPELWSPVPLKISGPPLVNSTQQMKSIL